VAAAKLVPALVVLSFVVYLPLFAFSAHYSLEHADRTLINDVSRLNPTYVKAVVKEHEVQGLQEALAVARDQGLKVSIAGKRHSMGGHAFYKDAVVLDMTSFDRVLEVNRSSKTVTVQSGATWKDVIEAINADDLSVAVMQAYNGFTVGGALSVNVHESDPNYGPLVQTVESFRLLLANGTIVNVDRTVNPELFSLVIGGYGLFGVILDVTLRLTDNVVLQKQERVMEYSQYYDHFKRVRNETKVGQIFARLSIAPDETLLRELVVTTYSVSNQGLDAYRDLDPSKIALKKLIFGLSRKYDWGKDFRWYLQKEKSDLVDAPTISRNNLMNGDLGFLDYTSATDTDILQEYFVPVDRLPTFIDELRETVRSQHLNLLSATIRYIPVNTESVMAYSSHESYGLVLYFNVGTSAKAQAKVQAWTRQLLDDSLALGGSYYLPYVLYASGDQFRAAYPNADLFFSKKRVYVPNERFVNNFYETYATR
jgi:FAD/FMN-containing dehydrogenase